VSSSQWEPALTIPVSDERDHIQGPPDAPVTLVEYGDYECPYCGAAYPIIKEIQARMGDRLRFVFRNFPITTSHPHSQQAAEAAEAASAQGKFWEMHDLLFENQAHLTLPHLRGYAARLALDMARFDAELSDHVYLQRVREHVQSGRESGVRSTPGFFVNSRIQDVSFGHHLLLEAVGAALKRQPT